MKEVADCLGSLRLDAAQVHLNLALYPLISDDDVPARYVLLDEALERDLAKVTEVSGAGSVPELAFENSSAEKILLVDGDELVVRSRTASSNCRSSSAPEVASSSR